MNHSSLLPTLWHPILPSQPLAAGLPWRNVTLGPNMVSPASNQCLLHTRCLAAVWWKNARCLLKIITTQPRSGHGGPCVKSQHSGCWIVGRRGTCPTQFLCEESISTGQLPSLLSIYSRSVLFPNVAEPSLMSRLCKCLAILWAFLYIPVPWRKSVAQSSFSLIFSIYFGKYPF